jgi:hypothetical protein
LVFDLCQIRAQELRLFKVELDYKVAVYFDAVNQYEPTNVPTSLTLPPVGIYQATPQPLPSNFTDQRPYRRLGP